MSRWEKIGLLRTSRKPVKKELRSIGIEKLSLHVLKKQEYPVTTANSTINIERLNEHFDRVCIFDSNREINDKKHLFTPRIIAIGATEEFISQGQKDCLEELQRFCDKKKRWLFGYLTYDLKNTIEQLCSKNEDGLNFPMIHFFSPKVVIRQNEDSFSLFYDDESLSEKEANEIYKLCFSPAPEEKNKRDNQITIRSKILKGEYIDSVNKLKQHIREGNIYEINFCQEFYAENISIDTATVYKKLNVISSAPFSAFGKFGAHHLICASPERFLQKRSSKLISQPIKGTIRRSENVMEDEQLKKELQNNAKEQSENVMIVDLVRNDLSRIAKKGSVNVDELFGIYTFKQVHQMISTVSCEIKENISFTDILKSLFPMGSMTGAPKISAMKLIEEYESTKRGLYSGAVGYISPDGDFDFNVVIRSILYNSENSYLSFMVGSAITDKAQAEQEYEECLLKAKAMFDALGVNMH